MTTQPAAAVRRPAAPDLFDGAEALARARALLPAIRARAAQAEADRRVPDETIEELRAANLFNIATPRRFGGIELGLGDMVRVAAELASACGSTGWVYGVLTGHNWMLGLFPEQAQAEVFVDPRALTASVFRLSAKVVPAPGGFRMTGGEGRFCSGVDYSDWVVVGTAVDRGEGGPPEPRFMLVPMSDVAVVDDWFTAGMRGTGSRSIRIADAFIPEHRTVPTPDLMRGTSPGAKLHAGSPTYAIPFPVAQPFSLIGAPLGMAQSAIETVAAASAKKLAAMKPEQQGEQGALFARMAEAAADVDAARALVLADCELLDTIADPTSLSPVERSRIMRNLAYAAQKCRYAATSMFEAGGGSGIYDSSPMQRIWRDANSATAHTAFAWDDASTAFGRALLGVPPSPFSRR
jgi:3-hydroxy-9,10-secoandrosta-1,3,5(10)-triene-9,17-dione monooxygenase